MNAIGKTEKISDGIIFSNLLYKTQNDTNANKNILPRMITMFMPIEVRNNKKALTIYHIRNNIKKPKKRSI